MKHAFTTKYDELSLFLANYVTVSSNGNECKVVALWDTGASCSCIATSVVAELGLDVMGWRKMKTPSGGRVASEYCVDVLLPDNIRIRDLRVCDSDIDSQDIGMLIGMDVISLGDFATSCKDGKTQFTFRIPSEKDADYTE